MKFRWPSPVSRSGIARFAFAAGCLFAGAIGVASAQTQSETLQLMLFDAVRQNNSETVRSIIQAGADVAQPDAIGKTAVDLAVENGHFDIARQLILARRLQQERSPAQSEPATAAAAPASARGNERQDQIQGQNQAEAGSATPAPYDKLLEAASRLSRAAEKIAAARRVRQPAPAAVKSISRLPLAPGPRRPSKIVPARAQAGTGAAAAKPARAGKLMSIGSDGSLKTIEDGAFKDMLAEASLEHKSAEEVSAFAARRAGVPPFWPEPGRKPAIPTGSEPTGFEDTSQLPPVTLAPVTDAPVSQAPAAPLPPSDVRKPETPALERLRRGLKTISRDQLKKRKARKKAAETEAATKAAAKDSKPLFLNRVFNGIGEFFGFGGSADKAEGKPPAKAAAKEKQARADQDRPPARLKPNPFDPDAVPEGARLPDSYAPPPPAPLPVPPVNIVDSADTTEAPKLNIGARRGREDDAPPPDLIEPLTRLAVPNPPVEQQLARITAETREAERAGAAQRKSENTMPLKRLRRPLTDAELSLGESVATGQQQLPRGIAEPEACINKQRGKVQFCIVAVDWPAAIEEAFSVNTLLYQGTRAIARYDAGRTTHLHTLFDAQYYEQVRAHLMRRFGPPTDRWARTIAPFNKPRQPNPTLVWRSRDTRTDKVTILELRRFDDTRSVFPDTEHGALRLYTAGAPKVFPIVTALDIMSIDWTARSDHLDGATPITASTLGVGR